MPDYNLDREVKPMAVAVIMPRQGNTVESCIITEWKKKVGDTVAVGDILFSYETDKAAFECEAETAGTLLKVLYEEGDDVPVLENVCVIGNPGENPDDALNGAAAAPGDRLAIPSLAPARLAPAAGAKVLFEIPAGTAVRVREIRGAWLRVLLPDGSSGWIPEPL